MTGVYGQDRTCVSGRSCAFELEGFGMTGTEQFLVLDTCGVREVLPGFPGAGFAENWSNGFLDWGAELLSVSGGSYRLCLCLEDCSWQGDYRLDIGELVVLGPQRFQDRTCVAGQTCEMSNIYGQFLSERDTLAVLETCGTHSIVPRFPSQPLSVLQTNGILTASWGDERITSSGGEYQLCWCTTTGNNTGLAHTGGFLSTSCGALEEFHTDFGQLSIIGPTTPVQQTCVSGHTCIIDAPTGYLLSASDSFQVLETCGVPGFIPGFPSVPEVVSTRGSLSLAWDSTTITAYGGQYRICWCASGMTCSQAEAFQVDAGQLVLIGPRPLIQGRTCVGMPCNITGLSGIHLASTDLVMLLDTCGLPAFRSDPGGFSGTAVAVTFSGQGAQIEASSSSPSDHLKGGFYRLCWCAGGIATDPCASHANFQTDFGEVYVVGSSPFDQHRTCVSGQTCAWSGINLLPGSLTGQQLILLDTCALNGARALLPNGAIVPHVQIEESVGLAQLQASWGSDRLSGAGGTYRACWCDSNCPIAEGHFFLDVATISILGPNPLLQHRTGRAVN